jgi:hypothetical protein
MLVNIIITFISTAIETKKCKNATKKAACGFVKFS